MKLPRKPKQWLREIEKAVDVVSQELEKHPQRDKQQFEAVLNVVIDRIAKKRGMERTTIAVKTEEVVKALTEHLKSIPDSSRNWTGIVAFLYIKFHQVLGLLDEQQMLKILLSQTH